jgi:adenine deaminase
VAPPDHLSGADLVPETLVSNEMLKAVNAERFWLSCRGHTSIVMPGLIGAEVHVESSAMLHFF